MPPEWKLERALTAANKALNKKYVLGVDNRQFDFWGGIWRAVRYVPRSMIELEHKRTILDMASAICDISPDAAAIAHLELTVAEMIVEISRLKDRIETLERGEV